MKPEFYILRMTVIFWFLFWGYILYCLFYPYTIFEYNILPLPVSKTVVKAGEVINYHGDYCKYVGQAGDVTHTLERKLTEKERRQHVSDMLVTFDVIKNTNLPMGCHTIDPIVPIPTGTPKGMYRIVKNIHVKMNMFRVVDLEFKSDWFQVI